MPKRQYTCTKFHGVMCLRDSNFNGSGSDTCIFV